MWLVEIPGICSVYRSRCGSTFFFFFIDLSLGVRYTLHVAAKISKNHQKCENTLDRSLMANCSLSVEWRKLMTVLPIWPMVILPTTGITSSLCPFTVLELCRGIAQRAFCLQVFCGCYRSLKILLWCSLKEKQPDESCANGIFCEQLDFWRYYLIGQVELLNFLIPENTHTHTHIHTHACTHTHTYTHARTYTHTHTHTNTHTLTHTQSDTTMVTHSHSLTHWHTHMHVKTQSHCWLSTHG